MTSHQRHPVLVASNRGPVSFGFADDGSLTARRGGGGMVSGLSSALAALTTSADATVDSTVDTTAGAGVPGSVLWVCTALSDADRAAAKDGIVAAGDSPGDAPVLMLDIPA